MQKYCLKKADEMKNEARLLKGYLQENKSSIRLPFVSGFPKNSCEVSVIVLSLIAKYNSVENLKIIKGYDRNDDIYHYWVSYEGELIDITIEQFGKDLTLENRAAIYKKFLSSTECYSIDDFLLSNEIYDQYEPEFKQLANIILNVRSK